MQHSLKIRERLEEYMNKNFSTTDIDELVNQGKRALDSGDYRTAKEILRRAISLAPFRKDLKDLLAISIDADSSSKSASPTVSIPERKQAAREVLSEAPKITPPRQKTQFDSPTISIEREKRRVEIPSTSKEIPPPPKGKVKHTVRGSNRALIALFVFGFLSFVAVAVILFFGEGIQNALVHIIHREPPIDPVQKEANQKLFEANSYINQELYPKAIETLEVALKLSPPEPEQIKMRLAQVCYEYGNQFYNDSKYKEAIEYYEKASKVYPKEIEYLHSIGHSYFYLARQNKLLGRPFKDYFEKAIKAYRAVLEIDPGNLSTYNDLARAHIGINQPQEAIVIYQKIIEIAPEDNEIAISAQKKLESILGKKIR